MMEVRAIVEASSSRQRAFNTSNQYISSLFSIFLWVICAHVDADPQPKSMRIRIHITGEIS
jgi:hypothetical protein